MANDPATHQVKVQPIEDFIHAGLVARLKEVFDTPVLLVNATDEIQAIKKLAGGEKVKYPFLTLTLQNFTRTRDTYRAQPLLRRGIDTLLSTDNKQVLKVSLMPVDFVFEVTYRHNEFKKLLDFAKMWLFAGEAGYLKYTVLYGQEFDIHVALSEDLAIPKREANPDNVAEYPLVSTLTVKGFMSSNRLRNQQAATEVDIDAYLDTVAKEGGEVFTFKRTWTGSEST